MKPGSLRGIFPPCFIIASHPANAVPHTPSFRSIGRILYQSPCRGVWRRKKETLDSSTSLCSLYID
jgi:hypothetical protein